MLLVANSIAKWMQTNFFISLQIQFSTSGLCAFFHPSDYFFTLNYRNVFIKR